MNDPLLVTILHSSANLTEHLEDEDLIDELVFAVPLDPLEQVPSFTILHDDHYPLDGRKHHRVEDFDHMWVIHLGL